MTNHVAYPGCYCADCVEGWPGGQAKEVLDDFRAAFAGRDETYWLIERRTSPPQWTKTHPATFGDLTTDVHQAMRYATEHQALDALRRMPSLPEVRAEFFTCEHMWMAPPSARITGDKDRENPVEGAPHTPLGAALIYAQNRIRELEAENERLREALVQHNDRLRSAAQIAARDGQETNWLSFRGQVQYTLAEYHELVNEIRAALEASDGDL